MFNAYENRNAYSEGAFIGAFETREAARAAILARSPRFAEVAFDLDGADAADMATACGFTMNLYSIERA